MLVARSLWRAASGLSDTGELLPPNIVTDLSIRFPRVAGKYAYLSDLSVTANGLVTVAFMCSEHTPRTDSCDSESSESSENSETPDTPVLAISVLNPEVGKCYLLESQYPGAGGCIVFGDGVKGSQIKLGPLAQTNR